VIVFVEATSGLDSETAETLMTAINDLAGRRALIIIVHRSTTLRRADVVHQLEGGQIVASGPVGQFASAFGLNEMEQASGAAARS